MKGIALIAVMGAVLLCVGPPQSAYASSTGAVYVKYTGTGGGAGSTAYLLDGVDNPAITKVIHINILKNRTLAPTPAGQDGLPHGIWQDLLDADHDSIPEGEAHQLINALPDSGTVSFKGPQDTKNYTYEFGSTSVFCGDLLEHTVGSYDRYDIYPLEEAPLGGGNTAMGLVKAADLRRLWSAHFNSAMTSDDLAAFQASIWEVIYETPDAAYTLYSGSFMAKDDIATSGTYKGQFKTAWKRLANSWLTSLGGVEDDPTLGLRMLADPTYQDFAVYVPGVGAEPVPEPLTILGLVLSVPAVAAYLRRRRARRLPEGVL